MFARTIKKFHKHEKEILDSEILRLIENPSIGKEKKGDLKNIFVHKFKIRNKKYLLSYRLKQDLLELITLGQHENYYRDLKTCLK